MKDALIALGMGGPDSLESIKPFLKNMLNDREMIDFGIGDIPQNILSSFIAARRVRKVAPQYEKMGGGSPQVPITNVFLQKLSVKYAEKTGFELDTYPAMCYWHPLIKEAVYKLAEHERSVKYRRIILLPMYPQYSSVTTGVCFSHFKKAVIYSPPRAPLVTISNYHLYRPYLDILAESVRAAALKIGEHISDIHLLFSAHSLPQSVIDKGDPYKGQIEEQCAGLTAILKPGGHSIAYQSKFGRKKWLSPSVKDELVALAGGGVKSVVVLAVSFINDNIETLIELDEDLIDKGRGMGLKIIRAQTPNDSNDFVAAIAALLSEI